MFRRLQGKSRSKQAGTTHRRQVGIAVLLLATALLAHSQSIASISPTSVSVGSPTFIFTANGLGFTPASTLYWWSACTNNGQTTFYGSASALVTTYLSSTEMTASVPASLLTGNSAQCGGAIALGSTLYAPPYTFVRFVLPSVSSVGPMPIYAGLNTPITVSGAAFVPGTTIFVSWQGSTGSSQPPLTTTFVTPNKVTAIFPANFIEGPGSYTLIAANCVNTSPPNYTFPACYDSSQSTAALTVIPPPSVVRPAAQ